MLRSSKIYLTFKRRVQSQADVKGTSMQLNYMKKLTNNESENEFPPGWDDARPYEEIPGPKPWPIVGNLWMFLPGGPLHNKTFLEQAKFFRKSYGPIVRMDKLLFRTDFVSTFDQNDFETLFRNDGVWPNRPEILSLKHYRLDVNKDFFNGEGGLLASQGDSWLNCRRTANPFMMQAKSAKMYAEAINGVTNDFVKLIELLASKNENREMPDDFINTILKWTLESVSLISLDTRLGCLDPDLKVDSDGQKMIQLVKDSFRLMFLLDLTPSAWRIMKTPSYNKFIRIQNEMTEILKKYLEQSIAKIKNKTDVDTNGNDASLLEKILEKDETIAKVMVADMINAGVESTGSILATALYYLAQNPSAQEKLRKEILEFLPEKDSSFKSEFLGGLPYLNAVIKETLRFAPPATGNIRKTSKNIILSGYKIPKGISVRTNNFYVSNIEENFPRANEFLPERWLRSGCPDDLKVNLNPFIYMPFGFGPRSCIGKRFAMLELEIGLAKIIRNFYIEWHYGTLPFKQTLVYGIDGALKLKMLPAN